MKQFILSIFIIILSLSTVAQQDTLLYKYRRLAVDYQQQIKMAEHNLAGAESMLEVAKSDFLPKFDFYGGYNYLGVPIQMASAVDGQVGEELQNIYSLDVAITQPILTGGYLKNTRAAAESKAELMRSYISLSKQEVMINSDIYYWNAVTKREISTILTEYRDAIGKFLEVIQDRVDEEVVGMNELYQAKVRYNDAEFAVLNAEKKFMISVMELNRSTGLPIKTASDIADSLLVIEWASTENNLKDKALEQRPEISMLESQISMNEYHEKITASKYNPKFGVGIGGNWGAPSPGLSTNPDFNFNVQAKVAIPIFYWGKKNEEVFANKQVTEISKLEMQQTQDMISLEVESSYYNLQQTQKQLDFAYSSLDNASQNVTVMLDRYYEGLSSVLEVLDAQLFWQKSYLNYIQAKYNLNTAYSSYQKAMGELSTSK